MRVLDTITGEFVEIDPNDKKIYWPYAILSHTWDSIEQTYQQLRVIQKRHGLSHDDDDNTDMASSSESVKVPLPVPTSESGEPLSPFWSDPKLSPKIREACKVARANGYRYLWIDSCCIDKTSSSELSESINSMYQWYARAEVCYAFLRDVPSGKDHWANDSSFRCSVWFGRGWTLQELIAPLDVVFLSKEWKEIGSKLSVGDLVADITKIDFDALLHVEPLDKFSVAQRLSWAADRKTTRLEDRAYSLLGIFGINMPTLYGEGGKGAFRRLQEEIMRRTPDQSLFAWTKTGLMPDPLSLLHDSDPEEVAHANKDNQQFVFDQPDSDPSSLLAPSPDAFSKCAGIEVLSHDEVIRRLQLPTNSLPTTDYDFTPYGIRLQLPVIPFSSSEYFPPKQCVVEQRMDIPLSQWYLVILGCGHNDFPGHLLGRICYTQSSGSTIESLYSGRIRTSTTTYYFDILPVSPIAITRIRSWHISPTTLYIPQHQRDKGAKYLATLRKPHETINLVLSKKTQETLSAQGYAATLRHPDAAHPMATTPGHFVTLVHDTHTITIHYQHTLAEHQSSQQQWTIEAHVKTSGLIHRVPPEVDGHPETQILSWTSPDHIQWKAQPMVKDIELVIPGSMVLILRLGATFAARDHYLLRIELWTLDN